MPRAFTVIIATRNRPALLERAICSILNQNWPKVEIIVVDDCSDTDISILVHAYGSSVRYFKNSACLGPGPSRNSGIEHASHPFVIVLDDDDELLPHALSTIDRELNGVQRPDYYPCFQFARTNGYLAQDFVVVRLEDFIRGTIWGDFAPVIQRNVFLDHRLSYPDSLVGGEGILWFEIAKTYGIPSWREVIVRLGNEAPTRLCSVHSQLARPREYAQIQEVTLERFGFTLWEISHMYYVKTRYAAAAYRILAGDRPMAREHLASARSVMCSPLTGLLWITSWMPLRLMRLLFRAYRYCSM